MRVAALLTRVVGWLLTPLVVWAASFLGAWFILGTAAEVAEPRQALLITFVVALFSGAVVFLLWRELLRRSPQLRHSLQVTTEGLPDLEAAEAEAEPDQPPSTPEKPA